LELDAGGQRIVGLKWAALLFLAEERGARKVTDGILVVAKAAVDHGGGSARER
jgi:hypothetical protein